MSTNDHIIGAKNFFDRYDTPFFRRAVFSCKKGEGSKEQQIGLATAMEEFMGILFQISKANDRLTMENEKLKDEFNFIYENLVSMGMSGVIGNRDKIVRNDGSTIFNAKPVNKSRHSSPRNSFTNPDDSDIKSFTIQPVFKDYSRNPEFKKRQVIRLDKQDKHLVANFSKNSANPKSKRKDVDRPYNFLVQMQQSIDKYEAQIVVVKPADLINISDMDTDEEVQDIGPPRPLDLDLEMNSKKPVEKTNLMKTNSDESKDERRSENIEMGSSEPKED